MLDVPAGTTTAVFDFYVPKLAPYAASSESVTVTAAGSSATASGSASGRRWFSVTLPLSPNLKGQAALPITILASKSFVPKKIGLNNDERELSVLLGKVTYR